MKKQTPKARAKSAPVNSESRRRAAIRALEQVALREADSAYRAAFTAFIASAEIRSPALAHSRSGTMIRIMQEAFEHATSVRRLQTANL
jgi:hypothetical protein